MKVRPIYIKFALIIVYIVVICAVYFNSDSEIKERSVFAMTIVLIIFISTINRFFISDDKKSSAYTENLPSKRMIAIMEYGGLGLLALGTAGFIALQLTHLTFVTKLLYIPSLFILIGVYLYVRALKKRSKY